VLVVIAGSSLALAQSCLLLLSPVLSLNHEHASCSPQCNQVASVQLDPATESPMELLAFAQHHLLHVLHLRTSVAHTLVAPRQARSIPRLYRHLPDFSICQTSNAFSSSQTVRSLHSCCLTVHFGGSSVNARSLSSAFSAQGSRTAQRRRR
jgi:hypothetical protein